MSARSSRRMNALNARSFTEGGVALPINNPQTVAQTWIQMPCQPPRNHPHSPTLRWTHSPHSRSPVLTRILNKKMKTQNPICGVRVLATSHSITWTHASHPQNNLEELGALPSVFARQSQHSTPVVIMSVESSVLGGHLPTFPSSSQPTKTTKSSTHIFDSTSASTLSHSTKSLPRSAPIHFS